MAKGQRDAADRPTVEPLLVEYAKVDKETASLVHFGEFPTTLDATRLQRVAGLMRTYGLLEKDFDVKPMLVSASGADPTGEPVRRAPPRVFPARVEGMK